MFEIRSKKILFISFILFSSIILFGQQRISADSTQGNYITKQEFENRINELKEERDTQFQYITWLSGFIGLLIVIFGFLQYRGDAHIRKLFEKQLNKGLELTDSSSQNIQAISSLIATMQATINNTNKLNKKFQKRLAALATLEEKDKNSTEHMETQITELNGNVMKLSKEFRRNSHNNQIFRNRIQELVREYENISAYTDVEEKLNANCHYILALNHRISNEYKEAIDKFDEAITLCNQQQNQPHLFPLLDKFNVDINSWLQKLKNVCYYHAAILYYNLGNYNKAIEYFKSAIENDKSDYESMTYIPEAMFLGNIGSFEEIESNFMEVIEVLEDLEMLDDVKFSKTKEKLLALAKMKLGNCYFGTSRYEKFNDYKNLKKAETLFREAYKYNSESSIIIFTLSQALYLQNLSKEEYLEYFLKTFKKIKSSIGDIKEAKILMMYYYILAICAEYGEIENEIPQMYLLRIYELRNNLPEYPNLRIYSPQTKNDLLVKDFISEVEVFQNNVGTKAGRGISSGREDIQTGKEGRSFSHTRINLR